MRAHGLLSPHRGRQLTQSARRDHCHLGASGDVGHRRRAGVHRGGRLGLDLRGGGPLERRVRGLACVQGGEPFCRPRADRSRARATLRLGRGGRGPRPGATDGPRQPVSVRPLPQPGPLLGIHPSFGLLEEPETNGVVERWNRTLREQAIYGGSFTTLPKCAPLSLRSSNATTSAGASRSSPIARHSKRARSTSYVKPRSANVCPRNRVRYTGTS